MSLPGEARPRDGFLARGTWRPELVLYERVELAGGISAPRRARTLARDLLGPRLGDRRRHDMLVVVTELVTNAVRHAGAGPAEIVVLHLAADEDAIRVEVYDDGPGFEPVERRPGPEGGFGLVLLRTLADRWGVATEEDTCVWFEMDGARGGAAAG
jgi:anti-sigma regulatory factor (Ser/Thr protein kinase)